MSKNINKNKYFLYARKSSESEDRQIQSIDDQINRLKTVAENLGIDVIEHLTEAKSAKTPNNRPVFEEMLERIENGEANGILCWQINRLARNPVDSGRISWLLQSGTLKSIQTVEREYLPEDNVLLFSVESGVANQFVLDLSKSVRRGIQGRLERGWAPNIPPLGYLNDKAEHTIIEDPERFDLTRKMWDLMLTGNYTPPQIVDIANHEWGLRTRKTKRRGGKPIARSAVYNMFSNPFYAGTIVHKGTHYDGKHTPMVSQEEFDRVQQLLGRENPIRPKRHTMAYRGPLTCGECGARITAEEKTKHQKNGNVHHYTYYRCTKRKNPNCSQRPIPEKELEKQIASELQKIEIPTDFKEWAVSKLQGLHEKEITDREHVYGSQRREYEACVRKIDNLIDMRANDEITEEEFRERKQVLLQEKQKYQNLLQNTDERIDNWLEVAERGFNFAEKAASLFEEAKQNEDLETKKEIFAALGSNLILKDKILRIDWDNLLLPIKSLKSEVDTIHDTLEPPKGREAKSYMSEIYAQNTEVQG